MNPQARALVELLTRKRVTIATGESLTAGLVAAGLADVPGASVVLRGGAVTYATQVKASVLGVEEALLTERGAIDADVAAAMASGARRVFGADVGVATTGVAGPTEQDGKPVGTVFIAVAFGGTAFGGMAAGGTAREGENSPQERGDSSSARESGEAQERCIVRRLALGGDRGAIRSQTARAAWELAAQVVHGNTTN